MDMLADIDVRCSVIVFRGDAVLLVHRDGADDWVLPGGTPRPGESMAACARRETQEETGLAVDPARVAFIAETLGPGAPRRAVDLVFPAGPDVQGDPVPSEPGLEARFVPLTALTGLDLRPPAGRSPARTACPRRRAHRRLPRQPVAPAAPRRHGRGVTGDWLRRNSGWRAGGGLP